MQGLYCAEWYFAVDFARDVDCVGAARAMGAVARQVTAPDELEKPAGCPGGRADVHRGVRPCRARGHAAGHPGRKTGNCLPTNAAAAVTDDT